MSEVFAHWQRALAKAPVEARLEIFQEATYDVGLHIADGEIAKPDATDKLIEIARARAHFGKDEPEIERIIADGFQRAERQNDDEYGGLDPALCRDADERAQRQEHEGAPAQAEAPPLVRLTFFDQLTKAARKPWLIKNVMARGETSSWVAPPAMAKSALLTEVAVHLGGGQDWRGYRTKEQCGVVYFAIERADLTKRRFTAHRLRDKLSDLPIAVAGDVIDLMNKSCVEIIVATIKQAEQHFGIGVGLAIFDTYAKGIAAGGGDEDKAKDQNIALANLRRVLDRVHIHIAGIGHTGKDESRGERGSNARLADVDVSVLISGDTTRTATVMKANDQPEGPLVSFQLEPFEFGLDEDKDPFRTFILSKDIIAAAAAAKSSLSDQQRLALEALAETILSHGRDAPAEYGLPHGTKIVTADQWKTELFRLSVLDPKASNPRARFNELRKRLRVKHLIGVRDDLIWSAHPGKQP
jgi:hypothetical protein